MTEADAGSILANYERVSKRANDLYKEAEGLIGVEGSDVLFRELMGSCAHLEEQAFFMSMDAGVGNLIRDTHARYVVQNFYRAGLYNDVIRFGSIASGYLTEVDSERTKSQVQSYVEAATDIVLSGHSQPLP